MVVCNMSQRHGRDRPGCGALHGIRVGLDELLGEHGHALRMVGGLVVLAVNGRRLAVEHRLAHLDREEEREEVADAKAAAAGADRGTRLGAVGALVRASARDAHGMRGRVMRVRMKVSVSGRTCAQTRWMNSRKGASVPGSRCNTTEVKICISTSSPCHVIGVGSHGE
jgi:hypothetical protein